MKKNENEKTGNPPRKSPLPPFAKGGGKRDIANLSAGEQWAYHVKQLRQAIRQTGGLFPGKTHEEVIELLRKTRDEVFEEKYAAFLSFHRNSALAVKTNYFRCE